MAVGAKPRLASLCQRASRLLGHQIFEVGRSGVRYLGAFEAEVAGEGRLAEEASFRLIARASSCAPADVAGRAAAFLRRYPDSVFAPEARLWLARADEDAYWSGGGPGALRRALDAYKAVGRGRGDAADEAARRLGALRVSRPRRPATLGTLCQ